MLTSVLTLMVLVKKTEEEIIYFGNGAFNALKL